MKVLERIHHFDYGAVKVRVWARSEDLRDTQERDVQHSLLFAAIQNASSYDDFAISVAERISQFDFTNAVEVMWKDRNDGVLIYPDWP